MSLLILIGLHSGIAGLILIAACVGILFLTIKKKETRRDHILVRLMVLGFMILAVAIVVGITGVILGW
jgi:asparagine N-glycosylation enzyme membrane subunit Stt3